ncbi:hypothetical protein [Agromyces sp. Leaf222]|uniref:hypothetical protein n=1 Tax=Agromyces sp. Leaf222 TaxID=1735688 RepID=UPI0006FBB2F1|nr:hypothetical protein [Agromyces sp. Leaf222]KQM82761.1 hypothetical protein ASE68_05375 [Agromyces sp. Leaf222]
MRAARLAPQDLDPIIALASSSILQHVGGAIACVTAIVLTAAHWSEVESPLAAIVAIALVFIAAIGATVATRPSRAPFTPERMWVIVVFGLGAAVAEYLSTVGQNHYVYDDFGPLVIGILMVSVAPYCSWTTLLTTGVLSGAVLAVLVAGAPSPAWQDLPIAVVILVFIAPTVVASSAAAGYSWAIVHITLAWQRRANQLLLRRDAEHRAGLARSSDQGRVAVLRREVLPFLASMLTVERVSVTDAARARQLAEALRSTLRDETATTWLSDLAADLERRHGVPVEVVETDTAVAVLYDDQRAALTALLNWLTVDDRASSVRVDVTREDTELSKGRVVRIAVGAVLGADPPTRRSIERFAAVARAVGLAAEVSSTGQNVTVEFRHGIS